MKTVRKVLILCTILLYVNCSKDTLVEPICGKKISSLIVESTHIINGNQNTTVQELTYEYQKRVVACIKSNDRVLVSFEHDQGKIIRKILYNNLEEEITIDSLFYNDDNQLIRIKTFDRQRRATQQQDLEYNGEQLVTFSNTVFFPQNKTFSTHFTYADGNIVKGENDFYTYIYEYDEEENQQNIRFDIEMIDSRGLGLDDFHLPILISAQQIRKITAIHKNNFGGFTFCYEHEYSNKCYEKLEIISCIDGTIPRRHSTFKFVY